MENFQQLVQLLDGSKWVIDESDLQLGSKLGDGASGVTFNGTLNGEKVAVKSYSRYILNHDISTVKNEIDILSQMHHKNIVQFRGVYLRKDTSSASLITRFEENGELGDALYKTRLVRRKGDALRFQIVIGLAEGLKYLHSCNAIHRDIKPANILLSETLEPLLTDFGFSRFFDAESSENMTGETGSYRYMAPEVTRHSHYTAKADVYSFAIICNEIFTEEHPYEYQIPVVVALEVVKKNLRPSQKKIRNERLKKIIAQCWDADPKMRPEWDTVIAELKMCQQEMARNSTSGRALSKLFRKSNTKGGSASTKSSGSAL